MGMNMLDPRVLKLKADLESTEGPFGGYEFGADMSNKPVVQTSDEPLDMRALDELIKLPSLNIQLILQPDTEDDGKVIYYLFAQYGGKTIRQIFNQRKQPRKFKDIQRALDWGKRVGFGAWKVVGTGNYSEYPDAEPGVDEDE